MWTCMTNQTLQTRDFRDYFMLPGERCDSLSQTHFKRPPWLTPGPCQISTELQDRIQPFGGCVQIWRRRWRRNCKDFYIKCVSRKIWNTVSIFEASWTAEPHADTRIATGPAGLVKIDNASRIYGSNINFVFQFVHNDPWPRTHASGTRPRTVETT
jgi:hypothetical protein